MLSTQIPEEFKDIRPYADDELPQVLAELMADPQFMQVVSKVAPDMVKKLPALLPSLMGGVGGGSSEDASTRQPLPSLTGGVGGGSSEDASTRQPLPSLTGGVGGGSSAGGSVVGSSSAAASTRQPLPSLTGGVGGGSLALQKALFYPLVQHIIQTCTKGVTLSVPDDFDRLSPHTFITNHRDIVLDSAFLSMLLIDNGFPTTVEIAIGDNLLIYPWIKKLVRINKSFIVQRSLSMREMLRASQTMSRYMHFAIAEKHENIWIAQREGRAKDSDDRTQDALLKMMAMGGEGNVIERLRQLHLTPMALSYEFDPCDYLKAKEFQQKRDIEGFRKSQADDLLNMQTGIFGQKGRVHFQAAPCIDPWLDTLDPDMPKAELFPLIAQHIDSEIHRNYRLFPSNYIAADALLGETTYSDRYTRDELLAFDEYLAQRIALIDLPEPDENFLRERLLTMYANPVRNKAKTERVNS